MSTFSRYLTAPGRSFASAMRRYDVRRRTKKGRR